MPVSSASSAAIREPSAWSSTPSSAPTAATPVRPSSSFRPATNWKPLVARLRERRRTVFACGFRAQSTPALEEACNAFRFLDEAPEEADRAQAPDADEAEPAEDTGDTAKPAAAAPTDVDPFALLHRAAEAVAEEGGAVWGTLVRQTMQSMHPGFTETDHGFETFADMLEDAQRRGIVSLERDSRSNTYYLSGLATR